VQSYDCTAAVCQKNFQYVPRFWYNKGNGGVFMEQWRKDARSEAIIVDLEALVPQDHLLRKIEKVMIMNGCMSV